jgi:hypothetical protein
MHSEWKAMPSPLVWLMFSTILFGAVPAFAQDVNSPAIPALERPSGPPSAPGAIMSGVPAAASAPTADPNAPLEGRASTALPPVQIPANPRQRSDPLKRTPAAVAPDSSR